MVINETYKLKNNYFPKELIIHLKNLIYINFNQVKYLVGVGKTTHTTHYTENVVVSGIDADLGSLVSGNGVVRKDKLESSVVDSGEVAGTRRLVLLRAKSERVAVNTRVRVASVVLVWLDEVEVGTLTLREAVLAVKHELSSYDRVGTPAVHVKSGLSEYERTGIRNTRVNSTSKEAGMNRWVGVSDSVQTRGQRYRQQRHH